MKSLSLLCDKNPLLALKMQRVEPVSQELSEWDYILDDSDVLFAYGALDGSLYSKIRPWLHAKQDRHLIWIAVDPVDAWGFSGLEDEKVTHCTIEESEVLKTAVWKTVLLKSSWAVPKHLQAPKALVDELRGGIKLLLYKARHFGKKELENVLENLGDVQVPEFHQLNQIPAVICGSGPSLDAEFLKNFEQKAFLFAGGSALGKLLAQGINPYFGAGVDVDPGQIVVNGAQAFFYTDRFSFRLAQSVQGAKFYMRSTDELPIEEWMLDQLGMDFPKLDLGWSVGCATAALAVVMGCDPIVFYGMDLADPKDKIEVTDKWGNPARSREDLIMSARWLSELIRKNPDRTWIDATPCGLEIQGARKQTLSELDFEERRLEMPAYKNISINAEPLKQKVKASLAACQKLCVEKSPAAVYELECEVFYLHHLKPLWQLFRPLLFKGGDEKMQAMLFFERVLKAYE
ncbi:MAG: DUF115 domain-containing protein [Chlamydiales bacterium]|nr:DUF115 domain-containing protein [Chlamydiales bacterium]